MVRSTHAQEQLHAVYKHSRLKRHQQQGRTGEMSAVEFLCQDLDSKLYKWFESRMDAPRIIVARYNQWIKEGRLDK